MNGFTLLGLSLTSWVSMGVVDQLALDLGDSIPSKLYFSLCLKYTYHGYLAKGDKNGILSLI